MCTGLLFFNYFLVIYLSFDLGGVGEVIRDEMSIFGNRKNFFKN